MLTPLIMKLEHFIAPSDRDKAWRNDFVSRRDEFPSHADIIREGEVPVGVPSLATPGSRNRRYARDAQL